MPLFSYRARTKTGEELHGTIDAISLQAARSSLDGMNLSVEELYETTKSERENQTEPSWSYTQEPVVPLHMEPLSVQEEDKETSTVSAEYFPLFETFRLYAGWLLAWYGLAYALGSYQATRNLPFRIPFAEALFISPLVLSFTLAAFLFLLCTGLYKKSPSKKSAVVLTIAALALFVLYVRNI